MTLTELFESVRHMELRVNRCVTGTMVSAS